MKLKVGDNVRVITGSNKNKEGKVLLDTNFLEDFKGEPLPLDKDFYNLLNMNEEIISDEIKTL